MNNDQPSPLRMLVWFGAALLALVLVVGVGVGGCAGLKSFSRAQKRANAHNQVSLTHIQVQNANQQAKVVAARNQIVQAQAQQRYLQSVGIRRAQDEIAKTLTPLYVQHEQIEALQAVATSGKNNTVVYVPSGQGGVPVITAESGKGK